MAETGIGVPVRLISGDVGSEESILLGLQGE